MANISGNFQSSNILAAGILGVALVASALILSKPPIASSPFVPLVARPVNGEGRLLTAPPIAQDAVKTQFREQILAGPDVKKWRYGGKEYALKDVEVNQVIYTAKEDTFTLYFRWVWTPEMPKAGARKDAASLSNDGYGHYYGTARPGSFSDGSLASVDVTIK